MISYDELPDLMCTALMLGLFLLLCGGIYMLSLILRRQSLLLKILTLLCTILSGSMMILYSADIRSRKHGFSPAPVSRWLCEKPAVIAFLLIAVLTAFLTYSVIRETRLRRAVITRSSIKESIDHLPTGLCFYEENGRVMLVNHRMNQLCHTLLGRDLQNAALMWEELSGGDLQSGILRISAGSQPGFRLPDGTVWIFSRENLQGVFQMTAADATQLYGFTEELKQKNIALEALNQRLKQYQKNVEKLTRSKECLETKARIHSELGKTLLATRSYLLDGEISGEQETVKTVEIWKRIIAMLRLEAEDRPELASFEILVQTAKDFGVTVEIQGKEPEQQDAGQLFLAATTEALTNAVRHAGARTLSIRFSETDTHYQISFQNDGSLPESEITEGGGLTSLRQMAETAGGSMSISCRPVYTLTVIAVKDGGETICPVS